MSIVNRTQKFYIDKITKYGAADPKNLWITTERQIVRFQQISKIFDLSNSAMLDVGCGHGDLYTWLRDNDISLKSYTGIDMIPQYCDIAQKNLPNNCKILCGDFIKSHVEMHDYCVMSGALNFYDSGWKEFAHQMINKMWSLCSIGMSFNLRSPHSLNSDYDGVDLQKKDLQPDYWCRFAHNKTAKYALYHNYVDYDFTVAMWKI